ncbi:ribonuclease H2, subunit C [Hyaloraphidium curvatum]|nr:ribonuclease H2, subunit C [Hyaloraphidium curvatum]
MASIATRSIASAPALPVHLLPCTVEHDGAAKVSTYFVVAPEHGIPADRTDVPRSRKTTRSSEAAAGAAETRGDADTQDTVDGAGEPEPAAEGGKTDNAPEKDAALPKGAAGGEETQDSGYISVGGGSPKMDRAEAAASGDAGQVARPNGASAARNEAMATAVADLNPSSFDPSTILETSFRGRKLKARTLVLPEGYIGCKMETVFRVDHARHADDDDEMDQASEPERQLRAVARFDRIAVWGHDDPPRKTEHPLFKTVNGWLSMSKALHQHVEPKEA